MWLACARRDIPIDRADIITMLVLADIFKLDAHPLEATPVLARQHLVHSLTALYLNVTHFTFELFLVQHMRSKGECGD